MPITVCHPAIAVPLIRFKLILSALIVGSMIPDFEFFLRLTDGRAVSHTFIGIIVFDIPVGLLLLVAFHKLLKYPLMSLLPHNVQSRLLKPAEGFTFFPMKRLVLIILSLIIGIETHLLWDSLTHADSWIVSKITILSAPVFAFPQGTIRVYFLLQYLGSALGGAYLVWSFLRWYYKSDPVTDIVLHRFNYSRSRLIILAMSIFSMLAGLSYGYFSAQGLQSVVLYKTFITHTVIAFATSFLTSMITFGLLWHFYIPHHERIRRIPDSYSASQITIPE